jgi:hypothetical protein
MDHRTPHHPHPTSGEGPAPPDQATPATTPAPAPLLPVPELRLRLYHLPLTPPTGGGGGIVVSGCFTAVGGTRASAASLQEIVVATATHLSLYAPPGRAGLPSWTPISTRHAWGLIRSLAAFRLPGTTTDYLVLGSDSGKLVLLGWEAAGVKGGWGVVGSETFGRSGCRRVVPGAMLAVDPKGRALMTGGCRRAPACVGSLCASPLTSHTHKQAPPPPHPRTTETPRPTPGRGKQN